MYSQREEGRDRRDGWRRQKPKGGKQGQKERWRKRNSDCLLDKILVFAQMTGK